MKFLFSKKKACQQSRNVCCRPSPRLRKSKTVDIAKVCLYSQVRSTSYCKGLSLHTSPRHIFLFLQCLQKTMSFCKNRPLIQAQYILIGEKQRKLSQQQFYTWFISDMKSKTRDQCSILDPMHTFTYVVITFAKKKQRDLCTHQEGSTFSHAAIMPYSLKQ